MLQGCPRRADCGVGIFREFVARTEYASLLHVGGARSLWRSAFCASPSLLPGYFLNNCVSESSTIRLLIFLAFAGLRVRKIESVTRATLPKFFLEDVHPVTWRLFSSFGQRYVFTGAPRIMLEWFARDFLVADGVIGTKIQLTKGGRATGFVKGPGLLERVVKRDALKAAWKREDAPNVGLGVDKNDYSFLALCKVMSFHGFLVQSYDPPPQSQESA